MTDTHEIKRRGPKPKARPDEHAAAPEYQMQGEGDAATADEVVDLVANHGPDDDIQAEVAGDDDAPRVLAEGWASMDTAPKGGKPCVLAGLIAGVPLFAAAYLHESRHWKGSATRWVPFKQWRVLNTPDPVPFAPLAWTRYQ